MIGLSPSGDSAGRPPLLLRVADSAEHDQDRAVHAGLTSARQATPIFFWRMAIPFEKAARCSADRHRSAEVWHPRSTSLASPEERDGRRSSSASPSASHERNADVVACILPWWTRGSERRNEDYRDFTAFYRFYHVYLIVESILELVIDALPKKNYRGISGITWELRHDRGSPREYRVLPGNYDMTEVLRPFSVIR